MSQEAPAAAPTSAPPAPHGYLPLDELIEALAVAVYRLLERRGDRESLRDAALDDDEQHVVLHFSDGQTAASVPRQRRGPDGAPSTGISDSETDDHSDGGAKFSSGGGSAWAAFCHNEERQHRAAKDASQRLRKREDFAALEGKSIADAGEHETHRTLLTPIAASSSRTAEVMAAIRGRVRGGSDNDWALIDELSSGGSRIFRLVAFVRRAFNVTSVCTRAVGVPGHEFVEQLAPLLLGLGQDRTAAARRRAVALQGALDPTGYGCITWDTFTSVFSGRGRSKDPLPEPFLVIDPTERDRHHRSMISAIFFANSWHCPIAMPPSLTNTLWTGGHDGTVLEWTLHMGQGPDSGIRYGRRIHDSGFHNTMMHGGLVGSFDTRRVGPQPITSLCMLPGAKLFASQSPGHGYVYDMSLPSRPVVSVVRTCTFRQLDSSLPFDETTDAPEGSRRLLAARALRDAKKKQQQLADRGVTSASILEEVEPRRHNRPNLDLPPIMLLHHIHGDITASCTSTSHYLGNCEPLMLGSSHGEVAIFNLRRSASQWANVAGGSASAPQQSSVTAGGPVTIPIHPVHAFSTFVGDNSAHRSESRVFQLLDVALDHSLLAVGRNAVGRHFIEFYDYEKLVPKLRLTRPGEGGTHGSGGDDDAFSRVPHFTRVDLDAAQNLLIATGATRVASLYTTAFPDPITALDDHAAPIVFAALDMQRHQIHVLTTDKNLHIYDSRMNRKVQVVNDQTIRAPKDTYSTAAFDCDAHCVVACSNAPLAFIPDADAQTARVVQNVGTGLLSVAPPASTTAPDRVLVVDERHVSPGGVAPELNDLQLCSGSSGTCVSTEGNCVVLWPPLCKSNDIPSDQSTPALKGTPDYVPNLNYLGSDQPSATASPRLGATHAFASATSAFFNSEPRARGAERKVVYSAPHRLQPIRALPSRGGLSCTAASVEHGGRRMAVVVGGTTVKVLVTATGAVLFSTTLAHAYAVHEGHHQKSRSGKTSPRASTTSHGSLLEEISAVTLFKCSPHRKGLPPRTILMAGGAEGTLLVVDLTHASQRGTSNDPDVATERAAAERSAEPGIDDEGVKIVYCKRISAPPQLPGVPPLTTLCAVKTIASVPIRQRVLVGMGSGAVFAFGLDTAFPVQLETPATRYLHDQATKATSPLAASSTHHSKPPLPSAPPPDDVVLVQQRAQRFLDLSCEVITPLGNSGLIAVLTAAGVVGLYEVGVLDVSLEMVFKGVGPTSQGACSMAFDPATNMLFVGDGVGVVWSFSLLWITDSTGLGADDFVSGYASVDFNALPDAVHDRSATTHRRMLMKPELAGATRCSTASIVSSLFVISQPIDTLLTVPPPRGAPVDKNAEKTRLEGAVLVVGLAEAHSVITLPVASLVDLFMEPGDSVPVTGALGSSWRGLQTAEHYAREREVAAKKAAGSSSPPSDAVTPLRGSLFYPHRLDVSWHELYPKPDMTPIELGSVRTKALHPAQPVLAAASVSTSSNPIVQKMSKTGTPTGGTSRDFPVAAVQPTAASTPSVDAAALHLERPKLRRQITAKAPATLTPRGVAVSAQRLVPGSLTTSDPATARPLPSPPLELTPSPAVLTRPSTAKDSVSRAAASQLRNVKPTLSDPTGSALLQVLQGDAPPDELEQAMQRVVISSADLQREIVAAFAAHRAKVTTSPGEKKNEAAVALQHAQLPTATSSARMASRPETAKHRPLLASTHLISSPRTRSGGYIRYRHQPDPAAEILTASVAAAQPPAQHSARTRPETPDFLMHRHTQNSEAHQREQAEHDELIRKAVAASQHVSQLAQEHHRTLRRDRARGDSGGHAMAFHAVDVPRIAPVPPPKALPREQAKQFPPSRRL